MKTITSGIIVVVDQTFSRPPHSLTRQLTLLADSPFPICLAYPTSADFCRQWAEPDGIDWVISPERQHSIANLMAIAVRHNQHWQGWTVTATSFGIDATGTLRLARLLNHYSSHHSGLDKRKTCVGTLTEPCAFDLSQGYSLACGRLQEASTMLFRSMVPGGADNRPAALSMHPANRLVPQVPYDQRAMGKY